MNVLPPRRVIHLIPTLAHGGAESMLLKLLARWDRQRFSHAVISMTSGGALADDVRALDIPVSSLGMAPGVPDPRGLVRLVHRLRQDPPAVLSTWLFHADLLGQVAAMMSGVRAVVWNVQCAELDPRDHPWHLRWTLRALARLSRRPAAVVVNAQAGLRASERLGYTPKRWVLIPSGFDLDAFAPRPAARDEVRAALGVASDTRLVVLVGRYHPMKDHAMFLDAAARVHALMPDVHFVLAGRHVSPDNAELAGAVASRGLGSSARLVGLWPDVAQLWAAADVGCCSSYSEGLPNVVGEAMASGVPCVSTDVGDCGVMIGDTGLVVPPRDARAFADALMRLLRLPPDERRALGGRARQRIADGYEIGLIAARYEQLFDEMVASAA